MVVFRILKKFRILLSTHQKIRIMELGILMIIGGLFEMLSISLMIPFINSIMNPEKAMQNKYIHLFCSFFNIVDNSSFIISLALIMALVFVVKNIFLLFQMTMHNRFAYGNMFDFQLKLLKSFMARPYEYYLGVKSGEILRIIGSDVASAFGALTNLLSFFSESLVSFTVLMTVFFIAPKLTIIIGSVLLLVTCCILMVIRPLLNKYGRVYQASYTGMNQWLLQSIQGIKEAKLMKKELFFQEKFSKYGKDSIRANYLNDTLSVVPRFMIEAFAMGVFFCTVALMVYKGTDLDLLVPVLSAVAMASMRLLPAMNRISGAVSTLSFREPAVDKVLDNLSIINECNNTDIIVYNDDPKRIKLFSDTIILKNIDYRYPGTFSNIFTGANLIIRKGMSVGIVGASGSGKTTAVDVILGLLKPQAGKVLVDGTDIQSDMDGWLSNIGYIPQSIFMIDGSIKDNVAFGVEDENVDEEAVWSALKEASLAGFVKSLPDGLDTQIGERGVKISGGQRQRIGIARALYTNPSVLVFDEATSALDSETETAIIESINKLHGSKTLIIIAHRLSTIEGCDEVYRVDGGKIVRER